VVVADTGNNQVVKYTASMSQLWALTSTVRGAAIMQLLLIDDQQKLHDRGGGGV